MPEATNSTPVRIRPATEADIAALVAIVNAAFAVETFIDGDRTDAANMAAMMQEGVFLVAEADSGIVASIYTELRGTRGYFGMLAVAPSHQGLHLGRLMIEAAEHYCREHGCQYMDITVLSLRTELPAFYNRFGYAETGREDFHPNSPLKPGAACHCIIMSKPL